MVSPYIWGKLGSRRRPFCCWQSDNCSVYMLFNKIMQVGRCNLIFSALFRLVLFHIICLYMGKSVKVLQKEKYVVKLINENGTPYSEIAKEISVSYNIFCQAELAIVLIPSATQTNSEITKICLTCFVTIVNLIQ